VVLICRVLPDGLAKTLSHLLHLKRRAMGVGDGMAVGEEGCDTVKLQSTAHHLRKTPLFQLRVSQLLLRSLPLDPTSHENTVDANNYKKWCKKQCRECAVQKTATGPPEAVQTEVKGGVR